MAGGRSTSHRSAASRSPARVRRIFQAAVRRALAEVGFAASGGPLIVAVSGGADSTALLLALQAISRAPGGDHGLRACHIDHGLRAAVERDAEQALLAAMCARLSVPLDIVRVDVAALRAAEGRSWEDAARRARYDALLRVAREWGATAVCTGHTADDQAETVLLHMARGTGVRGLRGMALRSRPWGAVAPSLLRPLLRTARSETEAYCRARGERWSDDSSNDSDAYARNRLRRTVLPALRTVQPGVDSALVRLASRAEALTDWLDGETARLLDLLARPHGDGVLLGCPEPPLHPFLAAEVVAALLARLLDAPGSPSARVVEQAVSLWQGKPGRRASLPGGWLASARAGGLLLTRSAAREPEVGCNGEPESA